MSFSTFLMILNVVIYVPYTPIPRGPCYTTFHVSIGSIQKLYSIAIPIGEAGGQYNETLYRGVQEVYIHHRLHIYTTYLYNTTPLHLICLISPFHHPLKPVKNTVKTP